MVCELAGNVLRGAQGRTQTVSFNQTLTVSHFTSLPDNIAMPPGCTIKGKVAVRARAVGYISSTASTTASSMILIHSWAVNSMPLVYAVGST
jgi:hypothetical protein